MRLNIFFYRLYLLPFQLICKYFYSRVFHKKKIFFFFCLLIWITQISVITRAVWLSEFFSTVWAWLYSYWERLSLSPFLDQTAFFRCFSVVCQGVMCMWMPFHRPCRAQLPLCCLAMLDMEISVWNDIAFFGIIILNTAFLGGVVECAYCGR